MFEETELSHPAELLRQSIVVNTSGSLGDPNLPSSRDAGGAEPAVITPRMIADARAAGVSAICMTFGHVFGEGDAYRFTIGDLDQWDACVQENAADVLQIRSTADIRRAKSEGRIGLVYAFQNSEMFGASTDRVEEFAQRGVRIMQLTYNGANLVGGGSLVAETSGLTEVGRDIIGAINHSKAIVDLSHSNRQTCLDAINASQMPVAITHTGCRAIADIPRNKSDIELRLVAEKGGYVGIYFMPFLTQGRNATRADLIAHLAHAINICGEDSIGIGTDSSFTPIDDMVRFKAEYTEVIMQRRAQGVSAPGEEPDIYPFVDDLLGTAQLSGLIEGLDQQGFSSTRIEKILGLNFLNYASRIWD